MDRTDIISRLNLFYSFERNQVDLYSAQAKHFAGSYTELVFERIAAIEEQHVENIAAMIEEFGSRPTRLGNVISPIIGRAFGRILPLSGQKNALKINIMLEKKAMQDYRKLIYALREKQCCEELVEILKSNHVDEDLHASLLTSMLEEE